MIYNKSRVQYFYKEVRTLWLAECIHRNLSLSRNKTVITVRLPELSPTKTPGLPGDRRRQTGGKQEAVTRSSVISTESYTCNCSHFFMISFKSDSAYSILGRCVGTIMLHNTTVISAKDHMDIKH